jgi:Polyketide cyclase / dehydrase and lipid transport
MATVRATYELPAPPTLAARLWTDVNRWPTFVDGFSHVIQLDQTWPEPGSKIVWQSTPAGRGRVTERILERDDDHVVAEVFDAQMHGRQAVFFQPESVTMQLDYELATEGPLRWLTDVLFIRRSLAMALERTLRRFSTEAADEASL